MSSTMARFQKGTSGNPGGRPKTSPEVVELARKHSPEAIAKLVEIMRSETAPIAEQRACALALLDRGYGRPTQSFDGAVTHQGIDPNTVSDAELVAFLARSGSLQAAPTRTPMPSAPPKPGPKLN
jgi:hypothetical protein